MFGQELVSPQSATFHYLATRMIARKALTNFVRHRSLRSKDRTPEGVQRDYDELRSRIEIGSFEEFVIGNLADDFALIDGRPEFTNPQRAREFQMLMMADLISRYTTNGSVVEFGSGTGRNLLYLARSGVTNPLVGLELSQASVDLARRAAAAFGLDVRFEQSDITKKVPEIGPVDVVFSVHAFEMMPRIFLNGLENIRRLKPRAAIFFEPIEELWPWSPRGLLGRLRVRQLDRLRGFRRAAAKLGRVVDAREVGYATNPLNSTALMVVDMEPRCV